MNSCAQPFRGSEQFNRHSQNRQSSILQARSYNAVPMTYSYFLIKVIWFACNCHWPCLFTHTFM